MKAKSIADFFSGSYAGAVDKFVAECRREGAIVEKWPHPLVGPEGEELATHTAYFGQADAPNVLVSISGTHGLEGLAGSGCQLSLIDRAVRTPESLGYLFIHMLNPWGAAWGRRQTEDNVDLNRNFLSFGTATPPSNETYSMLHDDLMKLIPEHPEFSQAEQKIGDFITSRGFNAYVAALFQGQYTHARGMNFGGLDPSWSNKTLHAITDRWLRSRRRVLVLDLHTGLGPFGYGTVISTALADSQETERLRGWLGADFVSLCGTENSLPYEVSGDLGSGMRRALKGAEVTAVALEFGTYDIQEMVQLQVQDCLRINRPAAADSVAKDMHERLLRFFYPKDTLWFEKITSRTEEVVSRLQSGLISLDDARR